MRSISISVILIYALFSIAACESEAHESGNEHHHDSTSNHHGHDHEHGHEHGQQDEDDENGEHGHHHDFSATGKEMAAIFNNPKRDAWQKPYEVISLFGDLEGKKIMDLGAGAGYFSFKLAEKGAHVIAAEVEQEFLDYMDKTADSLGLASHFETRLLPFDSPKLAEKEIDGMILVDVYHHMDNRVAYFKQVRSGMKTGGKLMILEHGKDRCEEKMPPIDIRMSPSKIEKELHKAGFTVILVDSTTAKCHLITIAE